MRRIPTRDDRCAHTFFSAITLAATATFWLNQRVLSLDFNLGPPGNATFPVELGAAPRTSRAAISLHPVNPRIRLSRISTL